VQRCARGYLARVQYEENARLQWIRHYVSAGQLDAAMALGWEPPTEVGRPAGAYMHCLPPPECAAVTPPKGSPPPTPLPAEAVATKFASLARSSAPIPPIAPTHGNGTGQMPSMPKPDMQALARCRDMVPPLRTTLPVGRMPAPLPPLQLVPAPEPAPPLAPSPPVSPTHGSGKTPLPSMPKPDMQALARCRDMVPPLGALLLEGTRPCGACFSSSTGRGQSERIAPAFCEPAPAPVTVEVEVQPPVPEPLPPPNIPKPGPEEVALCTQLAATAAALGLAPVQRMQPSGATMQQQAAWLEQTMDDGHDWESPTKPARVDPHGPLNLTTANVAAHRAQAEVSSRAIDASARSLLDAGTCSKEQRSSQHGLHGWAADVRKSLHAARQRRQSSGLSMSLPSALKRSSSRASEDVVQHMLIRSMGLDHKQRKKLALRYRIDSTKELLAKRLKNRATPHSLYHFQYRKEVPAKQRRMVQLQPHSMLVQYQPHVSVGCFVALNDTDAARVSGSGRQPTVRYVRVLRIIRTARRVPPKGKCPFFNGRKWEKSNVANYAAEYDVADTDGREVTPAMVVPHPMLVHVQLAEVYHNLTRKDGLKHSAAIRELQAACNGLPMRYQFVDVSVWKEPYSLRRIVVAWMFNLALLVVLLLTVFSYYLTRADDIEFGHFFTTISVIIFLQPFGSQFISIVVRNIILGLLSAFCLAACLGETPEGKQFLKSFFSSPDNNVVDEETNKDKRRREIETRIAEQLQKQRRALEHLPFAATASGEEALRYLQRLATGGTEPAHAEPKSEPPLETIEFDANRPRALRKPVRHSAGCSDDHSNRRSSATATDTSCSADEAAAKEAPDAPRPLMVHLKAQVSSSQARLLGFSQSEALLMTSSSQQHAARHSADKVSQPRRRSFLGFGKCRSAEYACDGNLGDTTAGGRQGPVGDDSIAHCRPDLSDTGPSREGVPEEDTHEATNEIISMSVHQIASPVPPQPPPISQPYSNSDAGFAAEQPVDGQALPMAFETNAAPEVRTEAIEPLLTTSAAPEIGNEGIDSQLEPLTQQVLDACATLQHDSTEKFKVLITWQRSSIAKLAVQVRADESALAQHDPALFSSPLPRELTPESASWAESQLAVAFITDGGDEQAQRLLQSVRAALAQGVELPSAPPSWTQGAEEDNEIDPIDLCVQLLSELHELARLHQRAAWLHERLATSSG